MRCAKPIHHFFSVLTRANKQHRRRPVQDADGKIPQTSTKQQQDRYSSCNQSVELACIKTLKRRMRKILRADLATSTNKSYKQKIHRYNHFCKSHKLSPLIENSVCYFVTQLAQSISFATILTYVAAIRHYLKQHKSPKYVKRMYLLKRLLSGIKRLSCKPIHKRN